MIGTPQNAPATSDRRPGQCSAWGCPLWASVRVGAEWICFLHAAVETSDWQAVTIRANQRRQLVRVLHRAMNVDPDSNWVDRATQYMQQIGRPELAPGPVRLAHPYRDRQTGQVIEWFADRDERTFIRLWCQRLASVLTRECCGADATLNPSDPPTALQPATPSHVGAYIDGGMPWQ